ncbi:MAG: ATP-binding cassette domain-containing protein [Aerococcus sp.]|nr:ATP-binding cassette domain-containing protein [Aerococcus sp.]
MITLDHVSVRFIQENGERFTAVDDVSLTVAKGEIFGVVGYSGAGKSTLVRTINQLQPQTSGTVEVNGQVMAELSSHELRDARKKIGMIFQNFNLLTSQTVEQNVAFPLRKSGMTKDAIETKVNDLLTMVGLQDRKDSYPSQLSGGQKQRVAIARALANDPNVLLCDEATSALDPKTTSQILHLLKQVNGQLGITIVIITHEMNVIKQICDRVAVMQSGQVIEQGTILDVFIKPQMPLTRDFIRSASPTENGIQAIMDDPNVLGLDQTERIFRIEFAGDETSEPVIATLNDRFQIKSSILFANVEILQSTPVGTLLISIDREHPQIEQALQYLESLDLNVEEYYPHYDAVEGGEA